MSFAPGHEPVRSMGMSQDTFYRYKQSVEDGEVEVLFERICRRPNLANRVDEAAEAAVIKSATDFPAYGQYRIFNELPKLGVFISPCGVRSIWRRYDLAKFKKRLKTPEAKVPLTALSSPIVIRNIADGPTSMTSRACHAGIDSGFPNQLNCDS